MFSIHAFGSSKYVPVEVEPGEVKKGVEVGVEVDVAVVDGDEDEESCCALVAVGACTRRRRRARSVPRKKSDDSPSVATRE